MQEIKLSSTHHKFLLDLSLLKPFTEVVNLLNAK